MADIVDLANANASLHLDAMLQHRKNRQQELVGTGTDDCVECGNPIPKARKKAMPHSTMCVPCLTELQA